MAMNGSVERSTVREANSRLATKEIDKGQAYSWDKPIHLSARMLHKDYDRKSWAKKTPLVVNLKGFVAKTKWLAVNRQS
jgi:hypothetical protein